jgi:RNase P/RNase MRP subunit p30
MPQDQIFIEENNFEKARKKIRENSGKFIIFSSADDELNRKILEKEKINVLLINETERKDFQKQRDSGLDRVMARLAKKSGALIGIKVEEISESDKKTKAKIISRVIQNIEICKKEKTNMTFVSKHQINQQSLSSLGLSLGMPSWMLKFIPL